MNSKTLKFSCCWRPCFVTTGLISGIMPCVLGLGHREFLKLTPYEKHYEDNQRRNQILEAQLRVGLVREEVTAEGQFMRRVHEFKLVHSQNPVFSLSWTAMHPTLIQSILRNSSPVVG